MKHLAAYLAAAILAAAGLYVIWKDVSSLPSVVTGAMMVVVGIGVAVPADLGQALSAASPVLNRVPMPQVARATIAQRISQSDLPPEK